MLRRGVILAILVIGISFTILSISAQETQIPSWVKGVANFWVEGNISDDDFGEALTFLIEQEIIRVAMPNMADDTELKNKVTQLESEKASLQKQITSLKQQNSKLQSELTNLQKSSSQTEEHDETTPTAKLIDIRKYKPSTNKGDVSTYIITYSVTAGTERLENIQVHVSSDITAETYSISSLDALNTSKNVVRIMALDVDSIDGGIVSYVIAPPTYNPQNPYP